MDHEGEVGKGSQHEGWDETGGYVVAWLSNKVDDHLKRVIFLMIFNQNKFAILTDLFGVSVSSCINDGVVVDEKLYNGLCALVYYHPRLDQHLYYS